MNTIIIKSMIKKNMVPGNSHLLGEMVFNDLLRLLKFIHTATKDGALTQDFIFNQQIDYLDEIWHLFILHTREYYQYCQEQFGEIIHHSPYSEEVFSGDQQDHENTFAEVSKQQFNLLVSYEGKDFVDRLFFQYPNIFGSKVAHE
ncbi:hypothetical protein [Bdellovibrio sp. HCB2-146]|uniref:hypothetical protein n=1 Tax=Bdellovibrio sp. HCB2-146 TaxID=3394362 RepID=UPI0039BD0DB3